MRIINHLPNGLVEYQRLDQQQRRLHAEVDRGAEDCLLICQFQPTYTAGRATKPSAIKDLTLPIIETDRGGSVTWHGPGQLVIYPIVKLAQPNDSISYIRSVEAGILAAMTDGYGLPVELVPGRAGIWHKAPTPQQMDRKLCAIGLKIARSATMHGLALNVNPDFSTAFQGIIPCGLADTGVCSLADFGITHSLDQVLQTTLPYLLAALAPVLAFPETIDSLNYSTPKSADYPDKSTTAASYPQNSLPSNTLNC